MALWEDIDEPVVRWVHSLPPILAQERTYEMAIGDPVDCHDIPGLHSDQVHDSLVRLRAHNLIDAKYTLYSGGATWYSLRVTADGLILCGEWPDVDLVASVTGLQLLLQQLAAASDTSDETTTLRRAAGAIGRISADIVRGTWINVAGGVGRELGDANPPKPPNDSGGAA